MRNQHISTLTYPIRKNMCTIHCHCDDDCCGSGYGGGCCDGCDCSFGGCCGAFWKAIGYFFMYLFMFIFYLLFFAFCFRVWDDWTLFGRAYFRFRMYKNDPSWTHLSLVCPPIWIWLCFCPGKYTKWIWRLWCLRAICGGGGIEDAMV